MADDPDVKIQVASVLALCEGAFSEMTLNGYRADLTVFQRWCEANREEAYPTCPKIVARFVGAESARVQPSTLKRRLAAIRFVHVYADLPDPTKTAEVRLAVRRALMSKPRRPAQALGLTYRQLNQIREACPSTLEGLRDAAIISVGYDALCRSSELVRLEVQDLGSDHASILIRRSKTDQAGDGRVAWFSPVTAQLRKSWLEASQVTSGPLFRSLHLRRLGEGPLSNSSIRRIVKRAAMRAGLSSEAIRLSGHSMRVGGAQDMLVAGFDTLAIMQAGGWKTPHIVLRYVERAHTQSLHDERWSRLDRGGAVT